MKLRALYIIAFLSAALAVRAVAQTTPAAAPAAGPQVVVEDTGPAAGVATLGTSASGQDTLTVDFPEEEIRTILRNVSDLFELNIVVPEELQGTTSIKLRDVTWRQIFNSVLDPVGYTFVEDGNIIKIVSRESLLMEPVTTEVMILDYANAADVLTSIQPLVSSPGGGVVVNARSNALVVTETPSQLTKIRPIVDALDVATEQVMIEAKFIEVTSGDLRDLGVNMSALRNYALGVNVGGTMSRDRGQEFSNGFDTTNGSNNSDNTTSSSTSSTDTSTSTSTGSPISTTTSVSAGTAITSALTMGSNQALNFLDTLVNTGGTSRDFSAVFSADQFGIVLSALNTLSNTKVVSNPTIVTLNNKEAIINVGREDPLPSYSYNEQRGSFEVSGFEYKPIGIILRVTPQVNSRGFITLTVAPEVSQRNGSVNFGGAGGAEIPIIATRKAETTVSLASGETMGIGGLITSETTTSNTSVPLLSDIPLLGNLFKNRSNSENTTNLLIFITARTVRADGAPVEEVFDSRQIRSLGISREDLPGYRDGSDPFAPAP